MFKVNLRPSQQQQAQPPLKMVIETGIKSPKKRKRVASTSKEDKDDMDDKRQKVSDGGDDAPVPLLSSALPTRSGDGKDNSSNHSHNPSSESDFSSNTGSHVSNSPVESPNLATCNSNHAPALYSASNLDTDISAHSGSKMDLDLKVLDTSSGNDMACDSLSQQCLAGPGETATSVHIDSKMEISDLEQMNSLGNSSNVTASSISSSSPSSVSTTVSSSVIASIADSSSVAGAVARAKFKTEIQAYPTLPSNMLTDVTNINLGGNMSEYVNFEYDYEDEFQ